MPISLPGPGTPAYLKVSEPTVLLNLNEDWSCGILVKPKVTTSGHGYQAIIGFDDSGIGDAYAVLAIEPTSLNVSLYTPSLSPLAVGTLSTGKWSYIVMCHSGTTMRVGSRWIENGEGGDYVQVSGTDAEYTDPVDAFWIGQDAADEPLDAYVANAWVCHRALSDEQMRSATYRMRPPPNCALWMPMLDAARATEIRSNLHSVTAVLTGTPTDTNLTPSLGFGAQASL